MKLITSMRMVFTGANLYTPQGFLGHVMKHNATNDKVIVYIYWFCLREKELGYASPPFEVTIMHGCVV